MRLEAIDSLIRKRELVSEGNIYAEIARLSETPRELEVHNGSKLDADLMNAVIDYMVMKTSVTSDKLLRLDESASNMLTETEDRIQKLRNGIREAYDKIRTAQVLEVAMSGIVKTLLVDFSDRNIIDESQSSNIKIGGSAIIGASDDEGIVSGEPIKSVNAKVGIRDESGYLQARMENTSTPIPVAADPSYTIANEGNPFTIIATPDTGGKKKIDLVIDRNSNSYFNQIHISLNKAELARVLTSEDGKIYTSASQGIMHIKDTVVSLSGTTDRYIKIVFIKNSETKIKNGKPVYIVSIKTLSVKKSSPSKVSKITTIPITVDGIYGKIAMSACSNEGRNVNIDYSISLDEGEWISIAPVGAISSRTLNTVISTNQYTDNKILLSDITNIGSKTLSTVSLPEEFTLTNSIRVGLNYTDAPIFRDEGRFMSCLAILTEEKEIDFGNIEAIKISGRPVSGVVSLSPGIYSIEIDKEYYLELYNSTNSTVKSVNGPEVTVLGADGLTRTLYDPLYPYNHRYTIINNFRFLMEKELIRDADYTIHNEGDERFLRLSSEYANAKNIAILYRQHISEVLTVRIKAEMQSLDDATTPIIDKISLRLS